MQEYLTNQVFIFIVIIAIIFLIFYGIINYIFSKYLISMAELSLLSDDIDNLSRETSKITDMSELVKSNLNSFFVKSEKKKIIKINEQLGMESGIDSLIDLLDSSSNTKYLMSKWIEEDNNNVKDIAPIIFEKIQKKQDDEHQRMYG